MLNEDAALVVTEDVLSRPALSLLLSCEPQSISASASTTASTSTPESLSSRSTSSTSSDDMANQNDECVFSPTSSAKPAAGKGKADASTTNTGQQVKTQEERRKGGDKAAGPAWCAKFTAATPVIVDGPRSSTLLASLGYSPKIAAMLALAAVAFLQFPCNLCWASKSLGFAPPIEFEVPDVVVGGQQQGISDQQATAVDNLKRSSSSSTDGSHPLEQRYRLKLASTHASEDKPFLLRGEDIAAVFPTVAANATLRTAEGEALQAEEEKQLQDEIFGPWIRDLDSVKEQLRNNQQAEQDEQAERAEGAASTPRYVILENFLNDEFLEKVLSDYPAYDPSVWFMYANPLEVKYLHDGFHTYGEHLRKYFYALSHPKIASLFTSLFQFSEALHYDPVIHGGGLHSMPRGGRLNMHLDYEKHPFLERKQRRLNVIFFLNEDWKEEWNGDVQLWKERGTRSKKIMLKSEKAGDHDLHHATGDSDSAPAVEDTSSEGSATSEDSPLPSEELNPNSPMSSLIARHYPKRNSAIVFKTDEQSYHGVPDVLLQPDGVTRDTITYYYLSDLAAAADVTKKGADASDGYRKKATYFARPTDAVDARMEELFKLRAVRRIEKDDLLRVFGEEGWDYKDALRAAEGGAADGAGEAGGDTAEQEL